MAKWRHLTECSSAPQHLPPPESCLYVDYGKNGRLTVKEKLETPLDERGIPDIKAMIDIIATGTANDYELPYQTNVHHLIYSRNKCNQDPVLREFREAPSNQASIQVQTHNLFHSLFLEVDFRPDADKLQFNYEQNITSRAFDVGRKAVQYSRMSVEVARLSRNMIGLERRSEYERSLRLGRLAVANEEKFWRMIDELPVMVMGIMPDPDMLNDLDINSAVALLGKNGADKFLDFRRYTQEAIYTLGVDPESIAA